MHAHLESCTPSPLCSTKSKESTEKSTPVRQSHPRQQCGGAHRVLTKRSAGTCSCCAVTAGQYAKAGTWKGIKRLHHALWGIMTAQRTHTEKALEN